MLDVAGYSAVTRSFYMLYFFCKMGFLVVLIVPDPFDLCYGLNIRVKFSSKGGSLFIYSRSLTSISYPGIKLYCKLWDS